MLVHAKDPGEGGERARVWFLRKLYVYIYQDPKGMQARAHGFARRMRLLSRADRLTVARTVRAYVAHDVRVWCVRRARTVHAVSACGVRGARVRCARCARAVRAVRACGARGARVRCAQYACAVSAVRACGRRGARVRCARWRVCEKNQKQLNLT